jgi:O-antigen ligase
MLLRFFGRESSVALMLAALLLWAPLPAGSVTPASKLLFRLAAFGLVLVVVVVRSGRWRRGRALPVLALGGVAMLGLVQSCPWPAGAAAIVSPEHLHLSEMAAGLGAEPSGRMALVPLSLDPSVSRSAAMSWLASVALLAAALVAGRRASHRRWLSTALVAAAIFQIGFGLVRLGTTSPGGLAAVLLRPEGRLSGTFANPNHLSLFFEIAMAVVAAWTWLELSRLRRTPSGRWARAVVPPLLWLVLLGGVVLTGSRAGLAAAVFGIAVQAAALPLVGRGRRAALAAGLVFLVGLGALIALGSRFEIRRYATVSLFEDNLRSRMLLVEPALELWSRFPATGTGLGTFEDAFPSVATPELTPVLWNRAHNDPLELLVTGGLVGFGLGLAALALLVSPIWRRMRRGRTLEHRAAGLAAMGALAATGVHELFDFGLVIPANALALLVVLGSAAAESSSPPLPRAASQRTKPARE